MKRYDTYKESGIEWIGEIPSHWEVKRLKYLVSINDDVLSEKTNEDFEIEYVDISSVESNVGITKTETYTFKDAPSRARRLVNDGDIIVSTVRTYLKAIAKIELPKPNLVVSTGFAVLRPRRVLSNYTGHLFYNENLLGEIISRSVGVSYPAINSSEIGSIPIPLPPSTEQTTIASYLDRKTAEIDALIADKKRLLELYEEEKTTIINQAVTKGIDLNVKMKDSGIEWLGEIPEHWEVKRLKYIAKVQTGRTPKIQSSQIDFFENGNINWFTPADFDGNKELLTSKRLVSVEALEKNEVELFPEFSIYLVSIGATLGKVSYFNKEASANQQINIISFNRDKYNSIFGYHYLVGNKEMITLEADYTTLPILNQSKTKNLMFVAPPIKEQQSIVCYIETECIRIDAKIAKTQKLIELLTEYRTALISEVVTGKIKVTD